MTTAQRRRVGRFKLLNEAEHAAHLSARPDPDHPDDPGAKVVDCFYCRTLLRPRRSTNGARAGSSLYAAVVDHFFHDCDAVEVDRG